MPLPEPGPAELLVEMREAGVNPFDWKIADGILRPRPHVFPLVLGVDGSGVVTRAGPQAHRFRPGDRICGQFLHDPVGIGTYAEFATVPESIGVAVVPPGIDFARAAALPTAGMTALDGLDFLQMPRGSSLLIVGASGGIGSFAVQLAAASGVRVLATARGPSADRVRGLGAETVLDPEKEELSAQIRRLEPNGLDGLLDLGSDRATFGRLAALVRGGGAVATSVYVADVEALARRGVRARNIDLQPRAVLLSRLLEEIGKGRLQVPIESEIPLSDAPRALAESRARRAVGKTVLRIRPDP